MFSKAVSIVSVLYLRCQTQKGKKTGVALTLPSGARSALMGYLAWKRQTKESLAKRTSLFVSQRGKRLSRKQAHHAFVKAYEKVGLEGQVTTHSPRKSYAKTVHQNSGNDLLVTQQALRHTSIETTLAYLDTLSDNVTQAMPNYDFSSRLDESGKTSHPKIVVLPKPAKTRAQRE